MSGNYFIQEFYGAFLWFILSTFAIFIWFKFLWSLQQQTIIAIKKENEKKLMPFNEKPSKKVIYNAVEKA
jgi:lipopolysaccharide export LptBFGC system permease protein LptF